MLVTSHSDNSSATWTAPAGMTSRVNAASLAVPNDLGVSLQVNTLPNAPDPTLARTASWTSPPAADTGDTHTLALRPGVNHFAVIAAAGAPDTCVAKNITITAQNAANATVTSYTGTINITTSSAHGNWSLVTGAGTLTPALRTAAQHPTHSRPRITAWSRWRWPTAMPMT